MPEQTFSDAELATAFRAYLVNAPTEVRAADVAHRLATEHSVRGWLPGGWTVGLRPAATWVALVVLTLLTLLAGLLMAGSWLHERAVVVAPSPPTSQIAAVGQWLTVSGAKIVATDPRLVQAGGGRVLVIDSGNESCLPRDIPAPTTTAAWVYDSRTAALSPAEPLPEPLTGTWRFATLKDGRVLAVGGLTDVNPLGHTWTWDPPSGQWTAGASLNVPRVWPSLYTLPDGRVLAVGGGLPEVVDGRVIGFRVTRTVEAYDAALDRWTVIDGSPGSGRIVVDPHGRLLSFPVGWVWSEDKGADIWATASDPISSVLLWDPDRASSLNLGPSMVRTDRDPALALPDETILTIDELGDARLFDRTTGWRSVGRLQVRRAGASFTVLVDGRVLVAGGLDPADMSLPAFSTAELFDPRTGSSTLIRMPIALVAPQNGVRLDDGSVLLIAVSRAVDGEDVACTRNVLRWIP